MEEPKLTPPPTGAAIELVQGLQKKRRWTRRHGQLAAKGHPLDSSDRGSKLERNNKTCVQAGPQLLNTYRPYRGSKLASFRSVSGSIDGNATSQEAKAVQCTALFDL